MRDFGCWGLLGVVVVFLSSVVPFSSAQPQCGSAPTTSCPSASTLSSVPVPWYSLNFSVNPATLPSVGPITTYAWLQTDNNADGCAAYHSGLLSFNGSIYGNSDTGAFPIGPWANLSTATGPSSVGSAIPGIIGGAGSGSMSAGTSGWSFELTVKVAITGPTVNYAKFFDLAQNQTTPGTCLDDIVMALPLGGPTCVFTTCSAASVQAHATFISSVVQQQWYHLVAVVQQTATSATYLTYTDGVLVTNLTGQPLLAVVPRPFSNLARSNWPGDDYFNGTIDTFNIYDVTLTSQQVAALYLNQMAACPITRYIATPPLLSSSSTSAPAVQSGSSSSAGSSSGGGQCSSAPTTSCPSASSLSSVPVPWYSLNFSVNPATLPSVGPITTYAWLQTDNNADGCAAYHSGLLSFNGSIYGNSDTGAFPIGPWANLSTATGPSSVGSAIPGIIGGAGSGSMSAGTSGWSFELTVKVAITGPTVNYAKFFDLAQNQTTPGTCLDDIVMALPLGGPTCVFTTCSAASVQAHATFISSVVQQQWYHLVAVVQQTATSATYLTYTDGVLVTNLTGQPLLAVVPRPFSNLARSNWPGDDYFNGTIDTFNIYDVTLTSQQVAALYLNQMAACPITRYIATPPLLSSSSTSAPAVQSGSSSSAGSSSGGGQCSSAPTTSCPSASSLSSVPVPWYSLNFSVNPATLPSVGPITTYAWLQTDNNADGCAAYHSGLLSFNGSIYGNSDTGAFPIGPWANLSTATGPSSVGSAIPGIIGGAGSGSMSAGTSGWSFELTVKVAITGPTVNYAKFFDLAQNQTTPGTCLDDIVMALPLGGPTCVFTTCSAASVQAHATFISSVVQQQWYHLVAVVQQTATSATYLTYTDGVLVTNLTGQPLLAVVPRPFSNLARSNWPGDDYFNGTIDTFNIYDVTLTSQQVAALYLNQMAACPITRYIATPPLLSSSSTSAPAVQSGSSSSAGSSSGGGQCSSAPTTSCPSASSLSSVPVPWYSLNFSVNPATLPSVGPITTYAWLQTDNNADGCAAYHSGLLSFNGSIYGNSDTGAFPIGPWANLSTATGPSSVGSAIPGIIGGAGSGSMSAGTSGWSFELTVKVAITGPTVNYAKFFDLAQNQTTPGTCLDDIVMALPLGGPTCVFTTCSAASVQAHATFISSVVQQQWYHLVAVVQQTATSATYLTYTDGVLVTNLTGQPLLAVVPRPFSNLARSNWPGDDYFNGTIDTFNIYDVTLTSQQVAALYLNQMAACPITRYIATTNSLSSSSTPASYSSAAAVSTGGTGGQSGGSGTATSQSSSSSSSSLSNGAIAGIVIGCVVGTIILCLLAFCAVRGLGGGAARRHKRAQDKDLAAATGEYSNSDVDDHTHHRNDVEMTHQTQQ